MDGLADKAGSMRRPSVVLSNGFFVKFKFEMAEQSSNVLVKVANDIAKSFYV
jgi:hypothetical protein